ncbi:MAG: ribosome biogenesis GTPase YlqF [Porticoccaceae bacterium]|nr:ribosome biogenesis GTPase YlqF [Porticoccaceae bacterium]
MAIQWYPGHMHKASKEMAEVLPRVNLVIEVLDARIPYSSSNPVIESLSAGKPKIKIFTKVDLADSATTRLWQDEFEQQRQTKTLAVDLKTEDRSEQIVDLCRKLAPKKDGVNSLVMVLGIPNVGKSTLINSLAGKHITRTGDEPAVTKGQQRINLRNGIMLLDTPGILWPKVQNEPSSYRLATTGAIKNTATTYEEIAFFAADYLLTHYPRLLIQRFQFDCLPTTEIDFLEAVGAQRGCLRARGRVDLERVSTIFVNELRAGTLGAVSFETPAMIESELADLVILQAEKAAREQARLERRGSRKKSPRGY